MPPRRRALHLRLWLLPALLGLATPLGCRGEAATTVTITLRIDEEALRPEFLLVKWQIPERGEREDRLPEAGLLGEKNGAVVASVTFELEPRIAGAREVTVSGFRRRGARDRKVSGATAKVPWVRGAAQQLTLTLSCADDIDDEEALKVCAPVDPDARARPDAGSPARDAAPPPPDGPPARGEPDAGVAEPPSTGSAVPDAGKPPEPTPDARPDVTPPIDDPPPVAVDAAPIDTRPILPLPPPAAVGELGKNLALYLRFDEGGRSLVTADGSGQGGAATLVNLDVASAWIPGTRGNALSFPATPPGWLRVTGAALNNLTDTFSISVWLRTMPNAGAGRRTIVARRAVGAGGFLYSLHLVGDKPGVFINSSNGANGNFVSAESVPSGEWVHLAVVYDRAFVRLWLSGRNVGEKDYRLTIPPENSPLCVGASEEQGGTTASEPLGADVDEIAVYDRALVPDEIAALARGFQPPFK